MYMHLYSQSDGSNIRTDQCCRFVILIINSVDFQEPPVTRSGFLVVGESVDFQWILLMNLVWISFFVDINVQCCI